VTIFCNRGLYYKTFYGSPLGAYPGVEHLNGASLRWALALPTNIKKGLRGLPWTNTQAYYENYDRKMFYSTGPRTKMRLENVHCLAKNKTELYLFNSFDALDNLLIRIYW
jgi:hypothetical protein